MNVIVLDHTEGYEYKIIKNNWDKKQVSIIAEHIVAMDMPEGIPTQLYIELSTGSRITIDAKSAQHCMGVHNWICQEMMRV